MCKRTGRSSRGWKRCAAAAQCEQSINHPSKRTSSARRESPKKKLETGELLLAAPKNQSSASHALAERESALVKTGILPAVDYWISAVQTLVDSPGAKAPKMEATSKAQTELERIEKQISELESAAGDNQAARKQLHDLHDRVGALRRQITSQMGPWQKVELARHPQRPYMMDYVDRVFTDFSEIHGDRGFADDRQSFVAWRASAGRNAWWWGRKRDATTRRSSGATSAPPIPRAIARRCAR